MASKERPILFSGSMVRAILEGRKTQTRRVVKPSLLEKAEGLMMDGEEGEWCPYGKPGDLLWVRETYAFGKQWDSLAPSQVEGNAVWYLADGAENVAASYGATCQGKWRPSIHMPRWASRLTLRITDIRVERVQAISRADAIAEGIQNLGGDTERWGIPGEGYAQHPCRAYWLLWDSINGKKPGASWADNPWVWAISFEREEATHGA